MNLTPAMRDALDEARRGPLRRIHDDKPGAPPWPAHPSTLIALVRHGLLDRGERRTRKGWKLEEWTITDAGREALDAPSAVRPDRPRFLDRRGYTTNPKRSIDHDQLPGSAKLYAVEVVDAAALAGFAKAASAADAERMAEQHARRLQARARTLRREVRAGVPAKRRGRTVAAELADVEQQLLELEQRGRLAA